MSICPRYLVQDKQDVCGMLRSYDYTLWIIEINDCGGGYVAALADVRDDALDLDELRHVLRTFCPYTRWIPSTLQNCISHVLLLGGASCKHGICSDRGLVLRELLDAHNAS